MDEDAANGKARARDGGRDAPDGARRAVAGARDYARRAAFTVAQAAADNTALTALAAGTALAAVGWLVARTRTRGSRR